MRSVPDLKVTAWLLDSPHTLPVASFQGAEDGGVPQLLFGNKIYWHELFPCSAAHTRAVRGILILQLLCTRNHRTPTLPDDTIIVVRFSKVKMWGLVLMPDCDVMGDYRDCTVTAKVSRSAFTIVAAWVLQM